MNKEIEIPKGYEARIEGNKVILEPKESEDERIRKTLIHIVKGACGKYGIKYKGDEITEEKLLAYLENQKEQNPANSEKPKKWSEEDNEKVERLRSIVNDCAFRNDALDVNGDYCEGDYEELDDWLKSLRPQPKQE